MKAYPKISVAVPTYKRPEFLRECLGSLFRQTLPPDEIVISDDGGDPETKAVIESFDPGRIAVRHVVNRPSLKQFANRVQAFRLTTGEFVAMLDDDDRWHDTFLETTVQALAEHPDCSFCSTDHDIMDQTGKIDPAASDLSSKRFGRWDLRKGVHHEVFLEELGSKCFPLQFTLFRRNVLEDIGFFPRKGGMVPDFALFLELGALGKNGYYVPGRHGAYRVHTGQQTVRRIENASSLVGFLDGFDTDRLDQRQNQAFRRFYNSSLIELAIARAHRREKRKSIETLGKLRLSEMSVKNIRRLVVLFALVAGFGRSKQA